MLRLASCIGLEHDFGLLATALFICAVGTFITARLLQRTITSRGAGQRAWVALGAIVAGSTTWCTHFVAMLAYRPGVPVAYEPTATAASLFVSIAGCAAAFGIASERGRLATPLGGAVFGISVTLMHYCGMAAFMANGLVTVDLAFVTVSASSPSVSARSRSPGSTRRARMPLQLRAPRYLRSRY